MRQVIRGSRSRFLTFWDLRYVSKAGLPSWNPYHMATTWGRPSGPMVATDMVCRSCRKASTSCGDIFMRSRTFAISVVGLLEELWGDRARGRADRLGGGPYAFGPDDVVDEVGGHHLLGRQPRLVVLVEASGQGIPEATREHAPDTADRPHGQAGVAGDGGRGARTGGRDHPARTHGAHLEHDEIAGGDGGAGAGRGNGVEHGVGALQTSDQM